ncbi:Superoxide dismutase [Alteripontixanthobacter maritimus]|uniref:Superoxide dismutase n=1 Tax=Alteripontixanthobacter maritimus TaxID=2161824 RepID=A0A369QCP8_9SPHN|nr:superoxide dismutase family protein [Alteripontixanthobacter maritimus]RDC61017.1 Superoxide dismutase [Alteripontixanthobacter maritimus]
MNAAKIIFASGMALAVCACTTTTSQSVQNLGSAAILDANGEKIGSARLLAIGDTVSITATVSGLAPGLHGFHLHETSQCRAPDFQSAGGHLNPFGASHGLESPDGAHLGDLTNLEVSADGTGSIASGLDGPRADVTTAIFDSDGTSVVIHAKADDYRTDPSGAAGSRIACGVIAAPQR